MSDLWQSDESCEDDLAQLEAINPVDVRVAAMDFLARREHTKLELKQKLKKRFDDEELIDEQLGRLAEENLQSDARFAESFLRQRLSRGHGPTRIRQEMRQRGISDGEISAAMEAEAPNWYDLAEQTYRRKFGVIPAGDIREKAKRSRFMQYRGFAMEYYQHLLD